MKQFIALLAFVFTLTSCNFTEEITFQEDGSGEFVMSYDMSEVMSALEEMGGGANKDEEKENVKIDSVMYFKDMLVERADSIATLPQEEQDKLKALEDIVIKMKMDQEAGVFDFGFGSTFTSLEDLPAALEKIEQAKAMNSKNNPQYSKMGESAVAKSAENVLEHVDFKYDGKTFSRHLTEDFEKSEDDQKGLEAEMNQMGAEAKEMFENMSYTLVYNFPKKVKSVSNKNATISKDGKTVKLKMNFLDIMKAPDVSNLDVVLED